MSDYGIRPCSGCGPTEDSHAPILRDATWARLASPRELLCVECCYRRVHERRVRIGLDALFAAFADIAREITTADLLQAASTVVSLSKTTSEKIKRLRAWAQGRVRFATSSPITLMEIARTE